MVEIPRKTNQIVTLIDDHRAKEQDEPRPHLGASLLGHYCDRHLWLVFRWFRQEQFSGRTRRIFRRGKNEERIVIEDLRAVGIEIKETGEEQDRVDFGNHVAGSMDGIALSGVPEAPNKPHVLEIKTHNKKSFNDLEKKGVQASTFQYYVQCQAYMLGRKVDRAIHVNSCKDDDRYYIERIKLDRQFAQKYVDRGHRITSSDRIPPPISTDATWYQCKLCSHHAFCHKSALPEVNCRTCAHSTACKDSTWRCERHKADNIPLDFQTKGCADHVLHPDLVPWELDEDASTEWQAVYIIDGKPVLNGPDGYHSSEIVANPLVCAHHDKTISEVKKLFPGTVIVG